MRILPRRLPRDASRASRCPVWCALAFVGLVSTVSAQIGGGVTTTEEITKELALRTQDLGRCIARLDTIETEMRDIDLRLDQLRQQIEDETRVLRSEFSRLHRIRREMTPRIVLGRGSGHERIRKLDLFRIVVRRQVQRVAACTQESQRMETRRRDLVEERRIQDSLRQELEKRRLELSDLLEETQPRID